MTRIILALAGLLLISGTAHAQKPSWRVSCGWTVPVSNYEPCPSRQVNDARTQPQTPEYREMVRHNQRALGYTR